MFALLAKALKCWRGCLRIGGWATSPLVADPRILGLAVNGTVKGVRRRVGDRSGPDFGEANY